MSIPMVNYPNFRPYSNVQPFTVRDGATYLLTLEALKDWIGDTLVPHVDAEISGLEGSWETQITAMQTVLEAAILEVTTIAGSMGETLTQLEALKLIIDATAVDAQNSADLAATYASDAANVQDGAITAIFNNAASLFRNALNGVYATQDSHDALAEIVDSGRLSETAINTRFSDVDTQFNIVDGKFLDVDAAIGAVPIPLMGLFDERPTASSVPTGSVYVATDVPEQYISNGSGWTVFGSGGNELGSAIFTGPTTFITSATAQMIAAFTVTFKVGYRPVEISAFARIAASTPNATPRVHIYLDGEGVSMIEGAASTSPDSWRGVSGFVRKDTLLPGSVHTVMIGLSCSSGVIVLSGDGFNNMLTVKTL